MNPLIPPAGGSVPPDDLPKEHVERPPLPWRAAVITECGLPAAGHPVITRDEFIAKVKRQGKQRAAFSTCMTCWETAQRWPTWEQDPVQRIARETYGGGYRRGSDRFRAELLAIEVLVAAHREEFDAALAGLADAPRLDEARRARRARGLGAG